MVTNPRSQPIFPHAVKRGSHDLRRAGTGGRKTFSWTKTQDDPIRASPQGTRINSLSKTDLIHRSFCRRRRNLCSVQSLALSLWGGEAEQAALVKIGISIKKIKRRYFHSTVLERERIWYKVSPNSTERFNSVSLAFSLVCLFVYLL